MEAGVAIGAAIGDHEDAVVGVAGFQQSGEDDAAGGDAEQNQSIDFGCAENHCKIGAGEGADAVLGDDNVGGFGAERGMDFAGLIGEQALVPRAAFDGPEERIAGADLGQARRKPTRMWMTCIPVARACPRICAPRETRPSSLQ